MEVHLLLEEGDMALKTEEATLILTGAENIPVQQQNLHLDPLPGNDQIRIKTAV